MKIIHLSRWRGENPNKKEPYADFLKGNNFHWLESGGAVVAVELQTEVPEDYAKLYIHREGPYLGPSPGWKCLLALSHLRLYAKQALIHTK